MVIKGQASPALLKSYHAERQPVAQSVIDSSGEPVRSTKFSATNTHAQDYVKSLKSVQVISREWAFATPKKA